MAKVLFGAVAVDARNKISGIVYSKNQFGGYVRSKVSPTQTPTDRRGLVRNRMTNLAKYFSASLTAAQVAAWNAFAKTTPITDVFGRSQFLSGIQAFCRLNAVILNVGGTQIDDPPSSLTIAGVTSATITATIGAPNVLSIAFLPTPLDTNVKLSVWATQALPLGRTFTKSFLRWIGASAAAAASPVDMLSAYEAKFGAFVSGTKIGFRIQSVDGTTGAQTSGVYSTVTVA